MSEAMNSTSNQIKRVGIVGYGSLGQYLVKEILERPETHELAFVWNRSTDALHGKIDPKYILGDLEKFAEKKPDLIVEVAHPSISTKYGARFLEQADYMVGSPTAFADAAVEAAHRAAAVRHGLYIPSGAFWGGEDIKKMADRGTLQKLRVTMKKQPNSFKFNEPLKSLNEKVTAATVLYEGPVRGLCPLAPNNVNTMAAAALAAHNLGMDGVEARLVSDPDLPDVHLVEVEAWGAGDIAAGTAFHVHTVRTNPARPGAVTGSATYASFLGSMLGARDKGAGVHLC